MRILILVMVLSCCNVFGEVAKTNKLSNLVTKRLVNTNKVQIVTFKSGDIVTTILTNKDKSVTTTIYNRETGEKTIRTVENLPDGGMHINTRTSGGRIIRRYN